MQTISQLAKISRRINRRLALNKKLLATAKDEKAEKLYLGRLRQCEAAQRRMTAVVSARVPTMPHRCSLPLKQQRKLGLRPAV